MGNQAFLIALMFWTMRATGSASLMGLLLMTATLPSVLLGPIAGTLADRHSRKSIIVLGDAVRGVVMIAMALVFFARGAQTELALACLFAAVVVSGVVGAVFNPAITAAIPDLVPAERVAAANSFNQLSVQGSTFIGQAAGGVLFAWLGAPVLFLVDGISYLLSALSEYFIRLPRRHAQDSAASGGAGLRSYLTDTASGLRFLWKWRGMRVFVLTATAVNFLAMPVIVLLPFYVTDVLGRGPGWYGFLLAAVSAGSVLGLTLAGTLRLSGPRRARLLSGALLGASAALGALGLVRSAGLALAVLLCMGVLTALINIFVITLVQLRTPPDMRGRVFGLVLALAGAASPLGMAVGGVVGDATGKNIPIIYVAAGALAILAVLGASTDRGFREFLATDQ